MFLSSLLAKFINSVSLNITDPDVGLGSWMIALAVEDFPHPDSPTIPNVSPTSKSKLIFDTACTKFFLSLGNSTTKSSTLSIMFSDSLRRWLFPEPAITPPPFFVKSLNLPLYVPVPHSFDKHLCSLGCLQDKSKKSYAFLLWLPQALR